MTETDRTPWQAGRDRVEATGKWPPSWGPFHRHFANDAVHRDGGPECDQPGTPRRVYVFDADALDAHERIVARYAAQHPDEFREDGRCICGPDSTGEEPDCRPDCPVHGTDAPYDAEASEIGEVPF